MISRLKKILETLGIQQKDLAKELNLSTSRLNNYMTGARKFPIEVIQQIVDYTKVNTHWLLTGEGSMLIDKDGTPAENNDIDVVIDSIETEMLSLLNKYRQGKTAVNNKIDEWKSDTTADNIIKLSYDHRPKDRPLSSIAKDKDTELHNVYPAYPKGLKHGKDTKIPYYSSMVCAGNGSEADDHVEEWVDINENLAPEPEQSFLLRIFGESMSYAGIHDGDRVIVDRTREPVLNDIVVARVKGEYTVKRYIKRDGVLLLHPENYHFPEIEITEGVEIIGVVSSVIRVY